MDARGSVLERFVTARNGNAMTCLCRILGRWRNPRLTAVCVFFVMSMGLFGQTGAQKPVEQKQSSNAQVAMLHPSDERSESTAVLYHINRALHYLEAIV